MNKVNKAIPLLFISVCLLILANTAVINPVTSRTDLIKFTPITRNVAQPLKESTKVLYSSVSKVSFAGTYQLSIQGLPSVTVTASQSRIGFKGCNIINFAYQAYNNGTFKVTSSAVSTQISCPNDQDSKYISIFSLANEFRISGSTINLLQATKTLLTLTSSKNNISTPNNSLTIQTTTVNQVLIPQQTKVPSTVSTSLAGNYSGSFEFAPAINVVFTHNTISFQGCNSHTIPYEAFDDGAFRTLQPIASTERFCQNDNDDHYIFMLTKADQYVRSGTTFTLTSNKVFIATFRI